MNEELIQKLVDQCVDKRERHGTTVEVLQSRKFAELIVRECDRYARSAWEHGPLLGKDLLIHFGIEEPDDGDIKS